MTRQVLRLFWGYLGEFKDEIHKGRPERVEVELPSGCLLRDACRLQVFRQTPGRSAWYVKKGTDGHFAAAVAFSQVLFIETGGFTRVDEGLQASQ